MNFLGGHLTWASQVAQVVKNPPASAGDAGGTGSIPGSGRSPGEGNGNPFQYSCLGNPMDRGAWWATSWGRKELDMLEHARRIDRACYGNFCYSHEEELKRIKDTPYRSKNLIILISIAS